MSLSVKYLELSYSDRPFATVFLTTSFYALNKCLFVFLSEYLVWKTQKLCLKFKRSRDPLGKAGTQTA